MPYCQYCTAPIRFVVTESGSRMPCDPHPDSTGSVAAREYLPGRWGDAYVITSARPVLPGYRRFVAHWATCDRRPPDPPEPPPPVQDSLI